MPRPGIYEAIAAVVSGFTFGHNAHAISELTTIQHLDSPFSFKFGVWFYMLSNLSLTVTAAYIGAREALLGRNGVYEGRDELRGVGETLPKRGA